MREVDITTLPGHPATTTQKDTTVYTNNRSRPSTGRQPRTRRFEAVSSNTQLADPIVLAAMTTSILAVPCEKHGADAGEYCWTIPALEYVIRQPAMTWTSEHEGHGYCGQRIKAARAR